MAARSDTAWQSAAIAEGFLTGVRGAIPLARTQIEVLLRVVRRFQPQAGLWLDVGCGDGILGRSLLAEFPDSRGVWLDFSEPMLAAARQQVGEDDRVRIVTGDLALPQWREGVLESESGSEAGSFDVVVSGFAIHHLTDARKRALYGEIYELLSPGGIFLNLEHVASCDEDVKELFAEMFVDALFAFHREGGGERSRAEIAEEFYYRPDKEANILAPVELQCEWLRQLGFEHVDCFFKLFEMALFGGVRSLLD